MTLEKTLKTETGGWVKMAFQRKGRVRREKRGGVVRRENERRRLL